MNVRVGGPFRLPFRYVIFKLKICLFKQGSRREIECDFLNKNSRRVSRLTMSQLTGIMLLENKY